MTKLDDILKHTCTCGTTNGQHYDNGSLQCGFNEAKQQIKDLMLEIVGEDEKPDYYNKRIKNFYRKELRQRINEL